MSAQAKEKTYSLEDYGDFVGGLSREGFDANTVPGAAEARQVLEQTRDDPELGAEIQSILRVRGLAG